jgi:hypothetical protein
VRKSNKKQGGRENFSTVAYTNMISTKWTKPDSSVFVQGASATMVHSRFIWFSSGLRRIGAYVMDWKSSTAAGVHVDVWWVHL